jgi:elongator complex protein 1
MRNISLCSAEIISFSGVNICATTIDLDQNVLYAASERQNFDNDVEIDIWKVGLDRNNAVSSLG